MSVIVMQVIFVQPHPNADTLTIYTMSAPEREPLQIVANQDSTYQVGEAVAVAQVGAKLKDGTKIRPAKLRGVVSYGMAIGPVEVPVGTDLSEEHCVPQAPISVPEEAPTSQGPVPIVKWTSIEQLHHVIKDANARRKNVGTQYVFPKIHYRAKIKLDGTNGGIHILRKQDGQVEVFPQSRSRLLTLEDDNLGFAKWVDQHRAYFEGIEHEAAHIILFGEWCGKGIQKRTSISRIDRKIFTVFAVQLGDHNVQDVGLEIEPARIQALLPAHPEVFVLPWWNQSILFDFGDREQLKRAAEQINGQVDDVEACDPWVKEHFDVEGLGEGVVMYPLLDGYEEGPVQRERCTRLMFKAKGEKHQVVKQKQAAQIDPEVAQSIDAFVDMFVTEARLEQALQEACAGAFDLKQTGAFLKWLGQDIKKESPVELEAAGLEWKQVSGPLVKKARAWFLEGGKAF